MSESPAVCDQNSLRGEIQSKRKWPIDIVALAIVAGHFWAITLAWNLFDLDHLLDPPIHSESDAWLLALSGIILLYFMLVAIVSAWGFVLGISTCLLVVNLLLRHYRALHRWLIACAVTAVLFTALSHYGVMRYGIQADEASTPAAPAVATKTPTLRDFDPDLPPVPLNELSEEEVMQAFAKAADAKCVAPKDPALIDACARRQEADQWQAETDKAR